MLMAAAVTMLVIGMLCVIVTALLSMREDERWL